MLILTLLFFRSLREIDKVFEFLPRFQSNENTRNPKNRIFKGDDVFIEKNFHAENNNFKECYFNSHISITSSFFSQNLMVGNTLKFGSGGAIFSYYSQVSIDNSIFNMNFAEIGGAISIVECSFLSKSSKYIRNFAFHAAGAIYGMCRKQNSDLFLYVSKDLFKGNKALSFSGAILIEKYIDIYFEYTSIYDSISRYTGGAISLLDCNSYFYYCDFSNNTAGSDIDVDPCMNFPHIHFFYYTFPNINVYSNNDIFLILLIVIFHPFLF